MKNRAGGEAQRKGNFSLDRVFFDLIWDRGIAREDNYAQP